MKILKEEQRPADLWFWDNWFASHDVKLCSLAAQGLWTNMLGIMRAGAIKGTLTVNGVPLGILPGLLTPGKRHHYQPPDVPGISH
jgi:hypothetical protein